MAKLTRQERAQMNRIEQLFSTSFNFLLQAEEKNLSKKGFSDLSVTEIHVIESVDKSKTKAMNEVAKLLKITPGSLTISANRLVLKGYLDKRRDLEDKRMVFVELTPKGIQALKVHNRFHDKLIESILTEDPTIDPKTLLTVLEKIDRYITEIEV
jgi:DNA-binding MarR family transcriptional regulator